jgi:hypothetical protein
VSALLSVHSLSVHSTFNPAEGGRKLRLPCFALGL